jgi:hypothetical protein
MGGAWDALTSEILNNEKIADLGLPGRMLGTGNRYETPGSGLYFTWKISTSNSPPYFQADISRGQQRNLIYITWCARLSVDITENGALKFYRKLQRRQLMT